MGPRLTPPPEVAAAPSGHTPIPARASELPAVPAAPAQPVIEPVNLVRPPREAGQRIGAAGARAASLDASLTTLRDERRHAHEERGGAQPRRKLWLLLAGSILGVGLVASAAVMFWPSAETSDASKEEASQPERDPASEPDARAEEPAAKQPPIAPQPEPETGAPAETEEAAEKLAPRPVRAEPEPPPEPTPATRTKTRPADEAKARAKRAKPKPAQPKPEPQARKPARLTISVFPWGNIWINGQPWGPAPLKGEAMPPGTYKISVGQGGPSKTQVVRLKAGQRKTVHFDLAAE